MFQRELSIQVLVRQYNLLGELLNKLEGSGPMDREGQLFYVSRTRQVARNLSRLRKLQKEYNSDFSVSKGHFTHSLHRHPEKITHSIHNAPNLRVLS